MNKILVVGAGMAGAVYARELADAGHLVHVIDQRDHIAGNCFDFVDQCGVRVHRYGPHLLHTSNEAVVSWLSRFTDWVPYEHKVVAKLPDGDMVPLPVNLTTVNHVFGQELKTQEEVSHFLKTVSVERHPVLTAEDHLYSTIGETLTDLFFRPYTKKMWAMDLREMDAAVVKRLGVRSDREDRYFPNDSFQAMPKSGFTAMFERILDHRNIDVALGTKFEKSMMRQFSHCFNSMPIDEFYEYEFGQLPYRSIKFHASRRPASEADSHVVINFTDDGPFTRETWWHNIPAHRPVETAEVICTVEEPCDYRDNQMERYYPVKTHDGRYDELYRRYKARADLDDRLTFIGRCGTYQYLDMHQVVNQSLMGVGKWLASAVSAERVQG